MNEDGGYKKLDNPVWYSLSETHRDISINYHNIKFYDHPIVPLEVLSKPIILYCK